MDFDKGLLLFIVRSVYVLLGEVENAEAQSETLQNPKELRLGRFDMAVINDDFFAVVAYVHYEPLYTFFVLVQTRGVLKMRTQETHHEGHRGFDHLYQTPWKNRDLNVAPLERVQEALHAEDS